MLDHGGGFTSLDYVNDIPSSRRDSMESFWLVSVDVGISQTGWHS